MSSKLLGRLQHRLSKVVPQHLVFVWEDYLFHLQAVFYGDEFLNNGRQEAIKTNTRETLTHNRKNNPNCSYMCLPYELKKHKTWNGTLYMDYVIGFHANPDDFSEIMIDLLADRLLSFERDFLD